MSDFRQTSSETVHSLQIFAIAHFIKHLKAHQAGNLAALNGPLQMQAFVTLFELFKRLYSELLHFPSCFTSHRRYLTMAREN